VPSFKPAYLIHGDDHGRIAERRARLRALAESESGAHGLELFEGDQSTPDAVAGALNAMTFAIGRRFIIVDGVERWKEREVEGVIRALAAIPPDTTVAFFAREEGRTVTPAPLHEAVKKAGGDVSAEHAVKPWELPKWVSARAKEVGITLESGAPGALVRHVGDRQQRLLRELEKLALEFGPGATLDAAEIEELAAPSAERKAWSLADALLTGDAAAATRVFLALRAQGERVPGLLYWMAQRLRQAHEVAVALEAGEPPAQVRRRLRMPSKAAEQLLNDARGAGPDRLRAAIVELAELELASRGGGGRRTSGRSEDTAALLSIQRIAA
jgi:DNA polymerase-3 subunit delta